MDAASTRGIDAIRELRENTRLSPILCPYKIYIIDEVHMLTLDGFNALLKTLEEPPPHVIFILATTDRHKVLKTITSRCQDFDFRYLEQTDIIDRLQEIRTDEEIPVDDAVLSLIARQSEGCLRDAENILERLIASTDKALTTETVHEILGLGASHLLDELTDAVLKRDLSNALLALASLAKQGTDLTQCLHQLIDYFTDLRRMTIHPENLAHLIQGSRSDAQRIQADANLASTERVNRIIKILIHANSEIKQHGYAQVHLESAIIDICSAQDVLQLSELLKRLSEIEDKIDRDGGRRNQPTTSPTQIVAESTTEPSTAQSVTSPPPQKSAPRSRSKADAPEAKANVQPPPAVQPERQEQTEFKSAPADVQNRIRDEAERTKIWEKALEQLRAEGQGVYTHFRSAILLPGEGDQLKIALSPTFIEFTTDDEKNIVSKQLSNVLGCPIQIEFVSSSTVPGLETQAPVKKAPEMTPLMQKRQAAEDKQLAPTLDLFDAEIIKIEPK
jgi:DNA polymerase-3 subunit gamma/tau